MIASFVVVVDFVVVVGFVVLWFCCCCFELFGVGFGVVCISSWRERGLRGAR